MGTTKTDATLQAKTYLKQLYRSLSDQGLIDANDFEAMKRYARAGGRRPPEARQLRLQRAGGHGKDRHARELRIVHMRVHAHDPPLARIELALEAVGRIGDLSLRVALADEGDRAFAEGLPLQAFEGSHL